MSPLRRLSAWIPSVAGLWLLLAAAGVGSFALVLSALPAAFLLAGGVRSLLVPDLRSPQHIATGAVFGMVASLPLALLGSFSFGLAVFAWSLAAFVAGGWLAISLEPPTEDVPSPAPDLSYAAFVALDDALLNIMTLANATPSVAARSEAAAESREAHALFTEQGWLEKPESFHAVPPRLEHLETSARRIAGVDCEEARFESEYDPDPRIPGRERWLSHEKNRTAHAWLLRASESAPWLVCLHGFGMGKPEQDFPAFRARELHARGLNVALVALPVHGPRAPGSRSGVEFLKTSPVDFVHGEAQAVWDLRRFIGWLQDQGAARIGVLGLSLGGYTSALLAGLEPGLDCVIAGIPPTDFVATAERFETSLDVRIARHAGLDSARDRSVHRVVSPLAFAPLVAPEGRFIFAATGDRLVPVEQVRALWKHWGQPQISWCKGGHVSALRQHAALSLIDGAISARLSRATS